LLATCVNWKKMMFYACFWAVHTFPSCTEQDGYRLIDHKDLGPKAMPEYSMALHQCGRILGEEFIIR
jgi:hypothetical protein